MIMATEPPAHSSTRDSDLTVFFDGACPLCTREIAFYRRLRGAESIRWIDVSQSSEPEIALALRREDALKRLHVKHADGRINSGGQAFADMWSAMPALAPIGRLFQRWPFSWILEGAYRIFLPIRPWLHWILKPRG